MRQPNKGAILQAALIAVGLLAVLAAGITFLGPQIKNNSDTASPAPTTKSKINLKSSPSPTPFEFQEMTIPYLRRQSFQSKINSKQTVSENAGFTSYLASYDSEGNNINALLIVPKGTEPEGGWPAVVFVHGYIPPQEYQTLSNYTSYAEYLADKGLVVFKIDLRGHADSEGKAFGAYYSESYVVDTLNAYSALQNEPYVNNKRVGLWGHSMAGNIVFRSMVVNQNIPNAVIWAGAVYTYEDFEDYRIQDSSYQPPPEESERRQRRERLFNTYGDFDPESDFWRKVVPTNYLNGVSGKLQIHHAINDRVVDIRYSRNLINILKDTEISAELVEHPSGGHNLTGANFNQAMNRSAEFLKIQ